VRGWEQVATTIERAASNYRDGEATGFENIAKHVTPELAYIAEVERMQTRVGEGKISPRLPCGLRQSLDLKRVSGGSCIDTQTR
jgi:hypothetical protein